MNDDFEQEVIEGEISDEEPLISHNHSNSNNYSNRNIQRNNNQLHNNQRNDNQLHNNQRNDNQRRNRGNNLNHRQLNNRNNNPLTNNANSFRKNNRNAQGNELGGNGNNKLKDALVSNRNRSKRYNNGGNNSQNNSNVQTSEENNKISNSFMNSLTDSASSSQDSDETVKIKIPLSLKIQIIIWGAVILFAIFIILLICAVFIAFFTDGSSSTQNIYTDLKSQEKNYCTELEVTFYKKIEENGTIEYVINEEVGEMGVATYDLETYVAGVIAGEVGVLQHEEVYKAFAVAARTYVLRNNTDCKVNSWDKFQVMLPEVPDEKFQQAAEDTAGEVLMDEDGNLINSEYDAFACYKKDDEYYWIKQKGMVIPIEWVEDYFPDMNSKWTACTMEQAHGRGMSQYGALYMAQYYNYSYNDLLYYFYGDQIETYYCVDELAEGSCNPNDSDCEPEYVKVCE